MSEPTTPCPDVLDVVIGLERHVIVVLRWPGLRTCNAAAAFATLPDGTGAVRSLVHELAGEPLDLSTVVIQAGPIRSSRLSAVVGVHCDHAPLRERAMQLMREHGAQTVRSFGPSSTWRDLSPSLT
jgi:hypothetical protein